MDVVGQYVQNGGRERLLWEERRCVERRTGEQEREIYDLRIWFAVFSFELLCYLLFSSTRKEYEAFLLWTFFIGCSVSCGGCLLC